jgi:Salmonella virulence plasmid 65kDa B protein
MSTQGKDQELPSAQDHRTTPLSERSTEVHLMSNKSGISSQVISLPKGGGALHGIGEKFAPDLHTGTRNFTVPIALPPERNGFQPQLNLVYSTGTGNGPYGLGWGLSIPGVSRKTSKGNPRYDDSTADRFRRPHDPAGQQPRFDLQVKNIRRTAVEIARHVRQRTARETNPNQCGGPAPVQNGFDEPE